MGIGFMWKSKNQIDSITYTNVPMNQLTDAEKEDCRNLYKESYGRYSKDSEYKPGQMIGMPPKYYDKFYSGDDFFIVRATIDERLVGHAIYVRKQIYVAKKFETMTWVVQLVVDKNHRQQGIASTLLHSIWGFSDDYAWGLASANPCTVKTLEHVTFRKCKPRIIKKNLKALRELAQVIPFIDDNSFVLNNQCSQVDSKFFVDNSEYKDSEYCDKYLGKLKKGHEWLAFTFNNQGINQELYRKKFENMVSFSESKLRDAYMRMDMQNQGWTKGTPNEVDFIVENIGDCESILDVGCGIGRHSIELASRGYDVKGIDYSDNHIECAKQVSSESGLFGEKCSFECVDIRDFKSSKHYDSAICLFDVIGSFPDEKDNLKIIKAISKALKRGGTLIASVMNMELTEKMILPENKKSLVNNPDVLLHLQPSNTMQKSGNVFQPEYLALDTDTGLVYRKEQFINDGALPAEHVIRDKRYTRKEICTLLEDEGFKIIKCCCVRSGHFDEPLVPDDKHAKEILIVAQKA